MTNHNTTGDSQAELILLLHMIPGIRFPIKRIEHMSASVVIREVEGENFLLNFRYRTFGGMMDKIIGVVDGRQVEYKVLSTMFGCIKKVEAIK